MRELSLLTVVNDSVGVKGAHALLVAISSLEQGSVTVSLPLALSCSILVLVAFSRRSVWKRGRHAEEFSSQLRLLWRGRRLVVSTRHMVGAAQHDRERAWPLGLREVSTKPPDEARNHRGPCLLRRELFDVSEFSRG